MNVLDNIVGYGQNGNHISFESLKTARNLIFDHYKWLRINVVKTVNHNYSLDEGVYSFNSLNNNIYKLTHWRVRLGFQTTLIRTK